MPREHDSTGDFVETVTHDNVLAVFDRVDGPPVITTSDIADALGCVPDTARGKLKELQLQGQVANRSAAGRTLWWRTDDGSGREGQRPAVVDVTHDFYSGRSRVTFANGVALTVRHQDESAGEGFTCDLTHPDVETEAWGDETIERPPAEILVETLDDYYNEEEDRQTKIPHLDAFMQEVSNNE